MSSTTYIYVICPRCDKEFDAYSIYGTKKFCSRSCANSRGPRTEKFKTKICQKAALKVTKPKQTPNIDPNIYPKNQHATIKYCAKYLNKPSDTITYTDVDIFKNHLEYLLNTENLSPRQIAEKFSIVHTNFAMYIKKCLGLSLKNFSQAARNHYAQTGRLMTDEKALYWAQCKFRFDPYTETRILNSELTKSHKWYHPVTNKNGITRDHMLSICDGWRNNIPAEIISHPANCHLLLATDNFKKNAGSSITYEQLLERIEKWDNGTVQQCIISRPKRKEMTDEHRSNLSKANLGVRIFTNGVENVRVKTNEVPPVGYHQGLTRRKK